MWKPVGELGVDELRETRLEVVLAAA